MSRPEQKFRVGDRVYLNPETTTGDPEAGWTITGALYMEQFSTYQPKPRTWVYTIRQVQIQGEAIGTRVTESALISSPYLFRLGRG